MPRQLWQQPLKLPVSHLLPCCLCFLFRRSQSSACLLPPAREHPSQLFRAADPPSHGRLLLLLLSPCSVAYRRLSIQLPHKRLSKLRKAQPPFPWFHPPNTPLLQESDFPLSPIFPLLSFQL